jgi:uncharacterized protein YdhG (YjbR/CyaY superfamily)
VTAVDDYFAGLDAPARAAFEHVRGLALELAPDAEPGTSYGLAALMYRRKPLLGFRAATGHLSLYPFSADVVASVRHRLAGYEVSKGTIRFTADRPVPDEVVREVVRLRLAEITG